MCIHPVTVEFNDQGNKEIDGCLQRCSLLLSATTTKELTAGISMAEALIKGFIGKEFEHVAINLSKLLLRYLVLYWEQLFLKLQSEQPTVELYKL